MSSTMKTLFLLIICLFSSAVFAQSQLNKVSVNPIQLLGYNQINIEYERAFWEEKWGIGFYTGHTGNASPKIHGQYSRLSSESFLIKRYSKSFDKTSFWYGGMITVASGEISSADSQDKATNIGALGLQGIAGYQFIIRSFYITPYLSAGYAITNNLFGSAEYAGNIGKPTKGLLTYGLKAGICF